MKFYKLLFGASIACLLTIASATAMADACLDGFIVNTTVNDIDVDGRDCFVYDTVVRGDVRANNGGSFFIANSRVLGIILVNSTGNVTITNTNLFSNTMSVDDSGFVAVANNEIDGSNETSNILLTNNEVVGVYNNKVDGVIKCVNNALQESSGNVSEGTDECR